MVYSDLARKMAISLELNQGTCPNKMESLTEKSPLNSGFSVSCLVTGRCVQYRNQRKLTPIINHTSDLSERVS